MVPLGNWRMSTGLEKGTHGHGEEMMLDLQKETRSYYGVRLYLEDDNNRQKDKMY